MVGLNICRYHGFLAYWYLVGLICTTVSWLASYAGIWLASYAGIWLASYAGIMVGLICWYHGWPHMLVSWLASYAGIMVGHMLVSWPHAGIMVGRSWPYSRVALLILRCD